jgi:hypothetical protein
MELRARAPGSPGRDLAAEVGLPRGEGAAVADTQGLRGRTPCATGVLPLRLRRQAVLVSFAELFRQPGRAVAGILPVHLLHGQVVPPEKAGVHPRQGLVLGLRHLGLAQVERLRQRHLVQRLVQAEGFALLLVLGGAHEELAGRNQHEGHRHAVGHLDRLLHWAAQVFRPGRLRPPHLRRARPGGARAVQQRRPRAVALFDRAAGSLPRAPGDPDHRAIAALQGELAGLQLQAVLAPLQLDLVAADGQSHLLTTFLVVNGDLAAAAADHHFDVRVHRLDRDRPLPLVVPDVEHDDRGQRRGSKESRRHRRRHPAPAPRPGWGHCRGGKSGRGGALDRLQRRDDFPGGLRAVGGVLGEESQDQVVQRLRDLRVARARRGRLLRGHCHQGRDGVGALEGSLAGGHDVEDAAQAEQVGPAVHHLAVDLLRGHVSRRPQDGPRLGQVGLPARGARQPEVEDLHAPSGR